MITILSQEFGEYSKSIYSVQTTEGDAISRMITGYIDIMLQRKSPIYSDYAKKERYTAAATPQLYVCLEMLCYCNNIICTRTTFMSCSPLYYDCG